MSPKKWIALAAIGVGSIDLLEGNTNMQILPSALGNVLTQQIDLVLIGIGVLLWIT